MILCDKLFFGGPIAYKPSTLMKKVYYNDNNRANNKLFFDF